MSEKSIFRIVMTISIVVFAAVVVLNKKILPVPEVIPSFVYRLPLLHAILNGTCFVLLLFSFIAIRKKKIIIHKRINITAFFLSSLFLISYVTYHWLAPETTFPKENSLRTIYLIILSAHIILAGVVLPLILMSFWYGLKNNIVKHKKIVHWTYPIWLYVTFSGVVVYLMISPYYHFPV
ncbi:MAG: DUF420 domain-containing protein [Bacteroidetes bacterium]|nr:DUF420 domain-containing protein [Bacteroidota bacterium]